MEATQSSGKNFEVLWTVFEFNFVNSKFVTVGTFYVSELNDKNRITRPLYRVVLMLVKMSAYSRASVIAGLSLFS